MALHVHRAARTDALADALAGVLAEPPADPFERDLVAVPTPGVERWLAQRLSQRLGALGEAGHEQGGVCARVEFPRPSRLVDAVVADAAGVPGEDDPWRPDALTWTVLQVVDEVAAEPWCRMLGAHLGRVRGTAPDGEVTGEAPHTGRRLAAAARIARLFAAYSSQRPDLVRDWAAGLDGDGAGGPLPADLLWQAELWRRVRARVGVPAPAERMAAACDRVLADPDATDLPARLSVFGPTRLPRDHILVLRALARHREVHLWLPHPSEAMWDRVASHLAERPASGQGELFAGGGGGALPRRRLDPTAGLVRHPLLASLGRDARELHVVLETALAQEASGAAGPVQVHRHLHQVRPPVVRTELSGLQESIRGDDPDAPLAAVPSGSVQVHSCYGLARQVEVLREAVLGLLADDPGLEPRDVLVLCPDVEAVAPLVAATFGLAVDAGAEQRPGGPVHPGHRLRVRLADRSLRRTNPLLDVAVTLLRLVGARCTATEVLDLADLPVVRRRFRFQDEDLERLRQWTAAAGVRWGLDMAWREPFRLPLPHNTWRAGLDRVLLGVAMRDEGGRSLATAVPLDEVDGTDADLVGRFAEFVDRLGRALRSLSGERPAQEWVEVLLDAVNLIAEPVPGQQWQDAEMRGGLAVLLEAAGEAGRRVPLSRAEASGMLAELSAGKATRANFRTGDLTVCSMQPMRSVPHRVVALLGMDDGALGGGPQSDDDVLARDPLVGERDTGSERRQLLLDAVLAAREHLIVCYTGADDRTNLQLPPAAPVGELLDALSRLRAGAPGGGDLVTHNPLQPFDPRHFGVPAPVGHPHSGSVAVASFDPVAHSGALALAGERHAAPPFLHGPLPSRPAGDGEDVVDLADLIAFVEHPVRTFMRRRLGVSLGGTEDELAEEVPVDIDGLARWQVGDRLLRESVARTPRQVATRVEWLRGRLPPGAIGARVVAGVAGEVDGLVALADPWLHGRAGTVDIAVDLDGTRLVGSVAQVHTSPQADDATSGVVRVEFSRLKAKHRLRAWVQVLACAAGHPGRRWQAVTVARADDGTARRSTITAPASDVARALLTDILLLYRQGMRAPLPLAAETSAAYAAARLRESATHARARSAAAKKWSRTNRDGDGIGEGAEPEHVLGFGETTLDRLCEEPAGPGDAPAGAVPGEETRFGALACRLWRPLLDHETVAS